MACEQAIIYPEQASSHVPRVSQMLTLFKELEGSKVHSSVLHTQSYWGDEKYINFMYIT